MQIDSRSSHPRILRGRVSEGFFDKSASGGFASAIYIYIQYASVCIRMHPYASIRYICAPECQYSTHVFAE